MLCLLIEMLCKRGILPPWVNDQGQPPTELLSWDGSLGLPLGLEALVMTPNGVTFLSASPAHSNTKLVSRPLQPQHYKMCIVCKPLATPVQQPVAIGN